MKLISYRREGREGYGVVTDGGIVDLAARVGQEYPTLQSAIAGLALSRIEVEAGGDADFGLDEVEFMFPITAPEKILCIGRNYGTYHEVLEDGGPEWPSVFPRFPSSFAPHGAPILKPRVSDELDFEGELCVVVGKAGRHIPEERAMDYVAGYTVMNEGSVREWQHRGTQNCPGKNFYRSGSIGPWMVTTDEVGDIADLRIRTRVDGELRQDGSTARMIFKVPFLIAHISRFTWFEPGDMIATGSPGGSAVSEDEPRWLRAGQEVEVEVERVGVLKNKVEAE